MILELMFLAALAQEAVCPETDVINESDAAWTDYDQQTLDHAKIRCGELYSESPCLKRFIKRTATSYHAVCGQAVNSD
jgi:hypothetical protein